ncbi:MAG: DegV family EDD domain-containing protein [Eubacteriaceae bacterium]|nr:DegV family EDD domain-containing protein [Eubacteriaceae bacterium]
MEQSLPKDKLAVFFAKTINNILKFEEQFLANRPEDVSFREIHVIEAVAASIKEGALAKASEIAAALQIAPGTFTASAGVLEKKGYLTRARDANDQRSVRVGLTEKGLKAFKQHFESHCELAQELLEYAGEDLTAITQAVDIFSSFYTQKEASLKEGKVKIYVDSTCDISVEDAQRLGITLVPMSINFGEETFLQNIDMTASEFFEKMAQSDTLPTTTQLTAYDLEQVYRDATEDGSEVVAIHLSSALSGTYQSAALAAREVAGVYPVDSQSTTAGIAVLVLEAVALRDAGMSAQSIAKRISELSERVTLLAYIPTFKYLVRGGRVSQAVGAIGGVMNIYPLISLRDGVVKSVGKARGKGMACKKIYMMANEFGIDTDYSVVFVHASAKTEMEELKVIMREQVGDKSSRLECEMGAVIGTHIGPGAAGFAFISKK